MYSTGICRGTERRKCHLRPLSLHVHADSLHAHMRMQGGGQTERDTHTVPTSAFRRLRFRRHRLVRTILVCHIEFDCRWQHAVGHRLDLGIGSYQRSLRTQRACRSTRIKELTSTPSLRQLTNQKNPFPPPFLTDAWLSQPLVSFSYPVRSCCSAAWLSDGIWWFRYIH